MKYSIVYNSKTGNTALLAEKLKAILPQEDNVYCGIPDKKAEETELIFVGFWTDKGSSDQATSAFLKRLFNKKIFLFGTAGFGGNEAYFTQILSQVKDQLDRSNTVVGTYMCQGKMPLSVRKRYESMLAQDAEKMQRLIDNFDQARSHPNDDDLTQLEQAVIEYTG